jgi:hypothetical protein
MYEEDIDKLILINLKEVLCRVQPRSLRSFVALPKNTNETVSFWSESDVATREWCGCMIANITLPLQECCITRNRKYVLKKTKRRRRSRVDGRREGRRSLPPPFFHLLPEW